MAAILEMSSSLMHDHPYVFRMESARGQTVQAVVSYIEARPKRMDEPFWQLTFEALLDAWPPHSRRPARRRARGNPLQAH
jgi:hypothetical protein